MIFFISSIFIYFTFLVIKINYLITQLPFKSSLFSFNPVTIYFWLSLPIEVFKIAIGPIILTTESLDFFYIGIGIYFSTLSIILETGVLFFVSKIIKRYKIGFKFNFKSLKTKNINFTFLSAIFFFLYLISFYLLASKQFGFINWIINPRTGYQLYREGAGQFWVFSVSFLALSFALIMLKNHSMTFRAILFTVYAYCAYLLGSKGMVVEYLIFFILMLYLYKNENIKKILVFVTPLILIIILYNFYTSVENLDFESVASYFTYYTNSGMYFKEYYSGKIGLFYGKLIISDFWAMLPRALFSNKPYVYGILEINEYFFPGAAEMTNTPAFGGPILYFADFGLMGVILFTLFNPVVIIRSLFYMITLRNFDLELIKSNFSILFLFLVFFAPYFLALIVFPLNFFFILFILFIFICYLSVLKSTNR